MKALGRVVIGLLAVIGLVALVAALLLARTGIGARQAPSSWEISFARSARHYAIPAAARKRANPVPALPETVQSARDHWADHCASCHGNDGSGDTEMGRGLYPSAPDMRQPATQLLTDGELFYIIENGVKLTGMPAWGTGTVDGEQASWGLVHFIRRLPTLTEQDISTMEERNPRSAEEWRALEEERKFLEGTGETPVPGANPPAHEHKGDHQ